jgi:uncharacterized protein YbaR (Trm112 family)
MIKNFLKKLICIKCYNKLHVKKILINHNRIVNGDLVCKICKVNYPIINGVINFSYTNKEIVGKVYNNYWNKLPINFHRKEDSKELFYFKKLRRYIKNKIVFDAGCGDGRSIKTICKHQPKLLICADFTNIIFYTAQKYSKIYKDVPVIFIKIDLKNKFINKNFINFVISLGSINFKIDQKKVVKNLDLMSKNSLLIGLVSNKSLLGKFYKKLNPVRVLFKLKYMNFFILYLRFLILNKYVRKSKIISKIGDYFYSLLEFIMSPIILRRNNTFYKKIVKKKKLIIYTGTLLDYLFFELK